jgi:hypothetical protein
VQEIELKGRHCSVGRLKVAPRELCKLFITSPEVFVQQFQHAVEDFETVVQQLEQQVQCGLTSLFALYDRHAGLIAHFRVDRFSDAPQLLGFHGGAYSPSARFAATYFEGSILLIDSLFSSHEPKGVLSCCLSANSGTRHFLSAIGFEHQYTARSLKVLYDSAVDVEYYFLVRDAYLGNRIRRRYAEGGSIPDRCANIVAGEAALPLIEPPLSMQSQHVGSEVVSFLKALEDSGDLSTVRVVDTFNAAYYLHPYLSKVREFLADLDCVSVENCSAELFVESFDRYSRLMSLLSIVVIDKRCGGVIGVVVFRLFPSNKALVHIAGGVVEAGEEMTFANSLLAVLTRLLRDTSVRRVQARRVADGGPWGNLLPFVKEGFDLASNSFVYSLVRSDVGL